MPLPNSFMTMSLRFVIIVLLFGYKVISFQIFFKFQNPKNKFSYVTNLEFQINLLEIFHPLVHSTLSEENIFVTTFHFLTDSLKPPNPLTTKIH